MSEPSLQVAALPPLYARWLDALLEGPIPAEGKATCDNCAMLAPAGAPGAGSPQYFNPSTKCCTYIPALPNYLVGRVLLDDDPFLAPAKAEIERALATSVCTPFGLDASAAHRLLYVHSPASFGHSRSLRCPHYREAEGGLCGIWRHRNATCATWFCKHERGAVGLRFWTTVHRLLLSVEKGLAGWCLVQPDLEVDSLERLLQTQEPDAQGLEPTDIDGTGDPHVQRGLWGRWWGREAEFFAECARRVDRLTWEQVLVIAGPETTARARVTRAAYTDLVSDDIPDAVGVGRLQIVGLHGDDCLVATYRDADPVRISRRVLDALHYFEGRSVRDAMKAMAEREGVWFGPDLILKLLDFQILVESQPQEENS